MCHSSKQTELVEEEAVVLELNAEAEEEDGDNDPEDGVSSSSVVFRLNKPPIRKGKQAAFLYGDGGKSTAGVGV